MPSTTAEQDKQALRGRVLSQLAQLTPQQLHHSDLALFRRFLSLPQVERADTIFAFWGVPGREPDTAPLVAELVRRGKRVGLPRMLSNRGMQVRQYCPDRELIRAPFGLLEPGEDCPLIPPEEIQLALVPGICFDRAGHRLGFGGGYYDRWLARFGGGTVSLCRSAVLQAQVPTQPHDVPVDVVVTEEGCFVRDNAGTGL